MADETREPALGDGFYFSYRGVCIGIARIAEETREPAPGGNYYYSGIITIPNPDRYWWQFWKPATLEARYRYEREGGDRGEV